MYTRSTAVAASASSCALSVIVQAVQAAAAAVVRERTTAASCSSEATVRGEAVHRMYACTVRCVHHALFSHEQLHAVQPQQVVHRLLSITHAICACVYLNTVSTSKHLTVVKRQ